MKAGLTTSVILHAAVLGFGLVSLSSPRAFEVADVEALPVDIIPVESITSIQQGDKKAPLAEKPAPLPTERPQTVPDAVEVGEISVDTDARPTPEPKPRPVETAALPEPSPRPEPKPVDEPEPEAKTEPGPAVVPATELKPEPEPRHEVEPEPVSVSLSSLAVTFQRTSFVTPCMVRLPTSAKEVS